MNKTTIRDAIWGAMKAFFDEDERRIKPAVIIMHPETAREYLNEVAHERISARQSIMFQGLLTLRSLDVEPRQYKIY